MAPSLSGSSTPRTQQQQQQRAPPVGASFVQSGCAFVHGELELGLIRQNFVLCYEKKQIAYGYIATCVYLLFPPPHRAANKQNINHGLGSKHRSQKNGGIKIYFGILL
jgi:hypothetical protein